MGQRGEAEIWLPSSFHCYLFKFRFHGQLIFSLKHDGVPAQPLALAHDKTQPMEVLEGNKAVPAAAARKKKK